MRYKTRLNPVDVIYLDLKGHSHSIPFQRLNVVNESVPLGNEIKMESLLLNEVISKLFLKSAIAFDEKKETYFVLPPLNLKLK
ncbi:hypothetical protein [Leptospira montravelensis]|uniref:hypothetical protein n=1 Tax=Leptospira montravelensis TaxID=2484961 RepID=UPI00142DCBE8|nr:hypothetical protein [Leptospira montravelensis]